MEQPPSLIKIKQNKTADKKAYMAEYNKRYIAEHSKDKRHCEICDKDINRYAWSDHHRTQRHLLNKKFQDLSLGEMDFKQKLVALCVPTSKN